MWSSSYDDPAPAPLLRVLIADDHAPTREDVRRALTHGGMIVCAEAADAARAVQQALETRPDICLLDLRMPGSGVAGSVGDLGPLPTTKVVMLTVSDDDAGLFGALRAGAVATSSRTSTSTVLPASLRDVAEGKGGDSSRHSSLAWSCSFTPTTPALPHDRSATESGPG